MDSILNIIRKSQVPDNSIRSQAENEFFSLANLNPSQVGESLIDLSVNDPGYRLPGLLYLKSVVLQHWSFAMTNFVGEPISGLVKSHIQNGLLKIVSEVDDNKIRRIASNLILNIAISDYPDEWPDLLQVLYSFIEIPNNETTMLGGLYVLYEIYDDLITENQFFEGLVGANTIEYCIKLLTINSVPSISQPNQFTVSLIVKNRVAKLFEIALKQIQGPEVFNSPARAQLASVILPKCLQLTLDLLKLQVTYFDEILTSNINVLNIENVVFANKLFEILHYLLDTFNNKLFNPELKLQIQQTIIKVLDQLTQFYYNSLLTPDPSKDKFIVHTKVHESEYLSGETSLKNLITELVDTLSSLSGIPVDLSLIKNLTLFNIIPHETYEGYLDNYNLFVTDEAEMSGLFTIRNSISDYLSDLPTKDANKLLVACFEYLNEQTSPQYKESVLKLIESLLINEDDESDPLVSFNIQPSFELLASLNTNSMDPFVVLRSILVIGKFLEKFQLSNEINYSALLGSLSGALNNKQQNDSNDASKLIQSAALISLTYFRNFLQFTNQGLNSEIQLLIQKIIFSLLDEAEEDTPAVLLEALEIIIDINLAQSQSSTNDITLIFKISNIDFSNLAVIQTAKDCLESLLKNISNENYLKQCEFGVPVLIENINTSIVENQPIEYTPSLNISLELLNIFIDNRPSQLPESLFKFVFNPLSSLLIQAVDDQILQIGGEVFNTVLVNSDIGFFHDDEIKIVLKILEKFLSPSLSDSAAMNVGSIVVSIVEKFNQQLSDYIPQILESATNRLLIAKHTIIIENLISVFAFLVLSSPENTLNFLASLSFADLKNGIDIVMPIWFDSFTTTRGYEKIRNNIMALGKIFLLKDPRINSLVVDGDILPNETDAIVTRSMAKKIPVKHAQISGELKILKLFIQELSFQQQQPDPVDFVKKVDNDEEGWEDLEDIGVPSFSKLQALAQDSNPSANLSSDSSQDLTNLLVNFLKESIQSNATAFSSYYKELQDSEKQTLALIGFA